MAMTVTARGTGGDNSTGTTTVIAPTSDLAPGSLGVIAIALDNAGSAGNAAAAPAGPITDSRNNIWTRRMNGWFDNGAASAGVEVAIYTANIGGGFKTTDTLTLTWIAGVSVVAKAFAVWEIVPTTGFTPIFSDQAAGTGGTNTGGTVTTNSIPSGNVVIGVAGLEGADSWSGDADTSNGSWTTQQHNGFGTGITGMSITSQCKIVTGTATQTYNPTCTSGDTMIGWASVTEAVNPFFFDEPPVDQRSHRGRLATIAANSLFFANLALTLYAPVQPPGVQHVSDPIRVLRRQPDTPMLNLLESTLAVAPSDSTNIFPAPLYVRPQYVRRIQDANPPNLLTNTLVQVAATIPQGKAALDTPTLRKGQAQPFQPVNLLGNTLAAAAPVDVFRDLQFTKIIPKFRRQQTDIPPNLLTNSLAVFVPPVDVFRELQVTRISYPKRRFQEADTHPNRLVPDFTTEYTARGVLLGSQPGRRIKVQTPFDSPNILISLLSVPPTPIQNRQSDWPNPVRRVYRAPVDGPTHTLGIQINTKPFKNDDWPNPVRKKYSQGHEHIPNTISLVSAPNPKPNHQDEYQNPKPARNTQTDIPPNLLTNTLAPAVVVGTDIFPAPLYARQITRTRVQDQIVPNTISLISTPNIKPNHQDDWQNPVRRKYSQPVHLDVNVTINLPEEVYVVVVVGSQAGRRIPRQQPFEFPNTIGLLSIPNPKPFHQDDWPNQARRTSRAPVDGPTHTLGIQINTKPFHQSDWQNPVLNKYRAPVDGPTNILAVFLTAPPPPTPFHQDDWQNPVRRIVRAPVDGPVNTLDITINRKPFDQSDWQNPRLRKFDARFDGPTNLLRTLLAPTPFRQDDWQNPIRRIYRAPVDGPVNTLDISINRKPFKYDDWQNPRRSVYRSPVDQILNSSAALFSTPTQPDTEGLEYTVITERLHYTVKSQGQAQFTSDAQRLGYTLRDEDHL